MTTDPDVEFLTLVLRGATDPARRDAIIKAAMGNTRSRMGTARDAAALFTPPVCIRTVERWSRRGCFRRVHLSARRVRYDLDEVATFARTGCPATQGVS